MSRNCSRVGGLLTRGITTCPKLGVGAAIKLGEQQTNQTNEQNDLHCLSRTARPSVIGKRNI
jgi:hypothetical protein